MSQEELAGALGRLCGYFSKVELGVRGLDVLDFLEMAGAVGLDPTAVHRRLRAAVRRRAPALSRV